jgi:hypothetical protein
MITSVLCIAATLVLFTTTLASARERTLADSLSAPFSYRDWKNGQVERQNELLLRTYPTERPTKSYRSDLFAFPMENVCHSCELRLFDRKPVSVHANP